MSSRQNGAFRLFNFAGITVYLHWSWFLIAIWHTSSRAHLYGNPLWAGLQYLTLFGIVLLHEFGHSFACRQVGGRAERIVLWPLGGIAYVAPPQRPGALLWSIAAGPLVNVLLAPLFFGLMAGANAVGLQGSSPDFYACLQAIQTTNYVLLVFNLLPVYPLDGGQILQAVLWFFVGHARSLYLSALLGLVGAGAVLGLAIYLGSVWIAVMGFFIVTTCWGGFQRARQLLKPPPLRHLQFHCPVCNNPPLIGALWRCPSCNNPVDTFAHSMHCPGCNEPFLSIACPECRQLSPASLWKTEVSHH